MSDFAVKDFPTLCWKSINDNRITDAYFHFETALLYTNGKRINFKLGSNFLERVLVELLSNAYQELSLTSFSLFSQRDATNARNATNSSIIYIYTYLVVNLAVGLMSFVLKNERSYLVVIKQF